MAKENAALELRYFVKPTSSFPHTGFRLGRKDNKETVFPSSQRLRRMFSKIHPGESISIHRRPNHLIIYMKPRLPRQVRVSFLSAVAQSM